MILAQRVVEQPLQRAPLPGRLGQVPGSQAVAVRPGLELPAHSRAIGEGQTAAGRLEEDAGGSFGPGVDRARDSLLHGRRPGVGHPHVPGQDPVARGERAGQRRDGVALGEKPLGPFRSRSRPAALAAAGAEVGTLVRHAWGEGERARTSFSTTNPINPDTVDAARMPSFATESSGPSGKARPATKIDMVKPIPPRMLTP